MAAVALSLTGASVAQAATAPMISPQPGTPDASTTTQISIFGVTPGTIESVRVTGSASGADLGRLERYSRDQGASYVMAKAFTPGETVTAVIRIKGLKTVRDRFGIEHPGTTLPILDIPIEQPAKLDHFVTDPALLPPKITVHRGAAKVSGDIFLTPLPSPEVHPNSNNELTIKPVGPGGADDHRSGTATSSGSTRSRRPMSPPTSGSRNTADTRCSPGGRAASRCRRSGSARA